MMKQFQIISILLILFTHLFLLISIYRLDQKNGWRYEEKGKMIFYLNNITLEELDLNKYRLEFESFGLMEKNIQKQIDFLEKNMKSKLKK